MSMMKTLARVAAGVMLAKGIGHVMKSRGAAQGGGRQTSNRQTGGGILGDLLGNNTGRDGGRQSGSGGLGDILGQVLGGSAGGAGTGSRYGGPNSRGAQGGLGGILDSLGGGAAAGGLGGLLGGLVGGSTGGTLAQRGSQPKNDASFGELFNDALIRQDEPEVAPTPEQNAMAALILKAMIQAAKSDGKIDDNEKQRLMGEFGEIDDEDRQFIREQMAAPVDPGALARETPKGMEPQVYMVSLMAIDFDNENEARYLHALAQALGLERAQVNAIHEQVGVQNLYSA